MINQFLKCNDYCDYSSLKRNSNQKPATLSKQPATNDKQLIKNLHPNPNAESEKTKIKLFADSNESDNFTASQKNNAIEKLHRYSNPTIHRQLNNFKKNKIQNKLTHLSRNGPGTIANTNNVTDLSNPLHPANLSYYSPIAETATFVSGLGDMLNQTKVINDAGGKATGLTFYASGMADAVKKGTEAIEKKKQGNINFLTYENALKNAKIELETKKELGQIIQEGKNEEIVYQSSRVLRYLGAGVLGILVLSGIVVPHVKPISMTLTSIAVAQCSRGVWTNGNKALNYFYLKKIAQNYLNEHPLTDKQTSTPIIKAYQKGNTIVFKLTSDGKKQIMNAIVKNIEKIADTHLLNNTVEIGLSTFYAAVFLAGLFGAAALSSGIAFAVGGVVGLGYLGYMLYSKKVSQDKINEQQQFLTDHLSAAQNTICEKINALKEKARINGEPEPSDLDLILKIKSDAVLKLIEYDPNFAHGLFIELIKDNDQQALNLATQLGLEQDIEKLKNLELGKDDIEYNPKTGKNEANPNRSSHQDGIDLMAIRLKKIRTNLNTDKVSENHSQPISSEMKMTHISKSISTNFA
ncbi:MAG: hypothetical protein GY874_14480 [Desulfobacteraceae bacterium]|nr:hypothetical protein [Desulfobacteraceae bacterium]